MKYRPPLALVGAPSPPSSAGVASPERRHVPAHRRRPLTPCTPAARSKLGIQGRRDDDDAAWLLVRLQRSTSGPDALGVAAARRRRARTCSLEAPHVDDSSSGAGPVGARSQWRTWLGSRYSSIRAGETGNSAHGGVYGTVQLQPMQWARLRQVEDERLYISTVPALEAELLPDP